MNLQLDITTRGVATLERFRNTVLYAPSVKVARKGGLTTDHAFKVRALLVPGKCVGAPMHCNWVNHTCAETHK
eukprot:1936078-Amphidinium_carterae.1